MRNRNFYDCDGPEALENEFARTWLPKSALARYLGLGNPAVTKMITGARQMRPYEKAATAAFFSIVPDHASRSFLRAVGKLRSKQARDRAGRGLADWASNRTPMAIAELLSAAMRGETLSADQIVALAVSEGLDLPALVVSGKVRRAAGAAPGSSKPPFADFDEAVLRWAEEAGAPEPYRLSPYMAPVAAAVPVAVVHEAQRPERGVELHPADCHLPEMTLSDSYLIADDWLAPRFEQGDVLFMERENGPVRGGDLVALVLDKGQEGILHAVIGRLLFKTKSVVSVSEPMGGRHDVATSQIRGIRRIVLCLF